MNLVSFGKRELHELNQHAVWVLGQIGYDVKVVPSKSGNCVVWESTLVANRFKIKIVGEHNWNVDEEDKVMLILGTEMNKFDPSWLETLQTALESIKLEFEKIGSECMRNQDFESGVSQCKDYIDEYQKQVKSKVPDYISSLFMMAFIGDGESSVFFKRITYTRWVLKQLGYEFTWKLDTKSGDIKTLSWSADMVLCGISSFITGSIDIKLTEHE